MSSLPKNVQVLVSVALFAGVALLTGVGVIILNELMTYDGVLGGHDITGWLDIIGLAIVASLLLYFVVVAIAAPATASRIGMD